MQVGIKDFGVNMEVKTRGVEFAISDNSGSHLGDLIITKSKLIWCEGKVKRQNGKEISWEDFRAFMNDQ